MQLFCFYGTTVILVVMLNSAQADEIINIRHGISKRDEESVCLKSRDVCRQMCHIVNFKDGVCVEGEDELCTCNNADDAPLVSDEGLEDLQRKKKKKFPKSKKKNPLGPVIEGALSEAGGIAVQIGVTELQEG